MGERGHQVAAQQVRTTQVVLGHGGADGVSGALEQVDRASEVGRSQLAGALAEVHHAAVGERLGDLDRVRQHPDPGPEGVQRCGRVSHPRQDQGPLAVQHPGGLERHAVPRQRAFAHVQRAGEVPLLGAHVRTARVDAGDQVGAAGGFPGTLQQPPSRRKPPPYQGLETALL